MKTRSLLLCGALAALTALCGCASIVETSKKMVNRFTGASDPNDTSLLAKAGRMQNAGTDAVVGAVGIKTEAPAPAPEVPTAPTPMAVPEPAPTPVAATVAPVPEPAASAAKKPVPKKVTAKPSSVKPVSTVPAKK